MAGPVGFAPPEFQKTQEAEAAKVTEVKLPGSLPEARIKSPPPEYWARGGRYLHRVGSNERTLQVLEFLNKIAIEDPRLWIRPSKIARELGLTSSYARAIMCRFKKESYVDVDHADYGKWHNLEVYRINDHGRWKLEELRKKLRGW